jgi:Ca2+-binding RTX toxin-like protein
MTLDGGAGDDVFTFSTAAIFAADSVDGGTGSNSVVLTTDAQTVGDADFDRIDAGTIQALTTANGVNSITLATNANAAGIVSVFGGTGADTFDSSNAAYVATGVYFGAGNGSNSLVGNSAADTFVSGTGNDILVGNGGADSIDAGSGTDTIRFATASDLATAATVIGGLGNDTISIADTGAAVTDANFDDVDTVEALVFTGGGNVSAILETQAQAAGIVSVFGGVGNDTFDASHAAYNATGVYFNGGGGADDLTGGGSTDTFVFATQAALAAAAAINGSGGNDTISLTTQGQAVLDTNFANVSAGSVEALAFANGTGSSAVLAGTADTAGIASVYGGSGNDTFTVDETIYTAPTFHGADGTDVLILSNDAATLVDTFFTDVLSVASFQTANGANDMTLGVEASQAGIATVTGGTGGDILNASAMTSAVTLMGGTGADTLTGGTNGSRLQGWALSGVDNTWNDSLTGGGGVDTFVLGNSGANAYGQFSSGNASNKVAFITGFTVGSDRFELFANGVNIGTPSSTFTNNGADQITITKTAGSTGYVLSYDDSINTAQLYVNGTSRLVAEISYTGDFANVANNNGMFSFV